MKIIIKASIILLSILLTFSCNKSDGQYYEIKGYSQGGTYHIIYNEVDSSSKKISESPEQIHKLIEKKLQDCDFAFSGYNKASLLTQINDNKTTKVNAIFEDIFNQSKEVYDETKGHFDPSAAPLFNVWGFGFSNEQNVSQAMIDSIENFVGMDKAEIVNGHIIKNDSRFQLNFNAIAQGYTCDYIGLALDSLGIKDYLVEVGMEILCKGKNASDKDWNIGVDAPIDSNMQAGAELQNVIDITDCGIVTSGNYRKFRMIDGKKYAHTIDPTTGYPVRHNLLSATVVAKTSALADAYATYCMVIGLEKSKTFLNSRTDLEGYLIYDKDGEFKTYFTKGLSTKIK
ncbi:MAG: FAD:protein FMN transferase [Bacteroidales bacterium]